MLTSTHSLNVLGSTGAASRATTVTLCFSKQTVMYTRVAAFTRRTRVVLPGLTVISGRCWLLHLLLPTAGVDTTAEAE